MALTALERSLIRQYGGWSERYFQEDNALERAMNAIDTLTDVLPLFQNPIGGSPPGYLASLQDIDSKMIAAHARFKADQVGSIALNRQEVMQLAREGKRITSRMFAKLGVEVKVDVWSGRLPRARSASGLGTYQVHS